MLDRLLDLLVIAAIRAWFSRPDAEAPAWYRAHTDPVVGKALRMLHNNPAHPWTVAELAAESGISRAALARRFTDLVGEPPMTFLTGWRLALAADLLRESDATVGAVAHKVGYGSPFALSTAFKRVHGISPRATPAPSRPPLGVLMKFRRSYGRRNFTRSEVEIGSDPEDVGDEVGVVLLALRPQVDAVVVEALARALGRQHLPVEQDLVVALVIGGPQQRVVLGRPRRDRPSRSSGSRSARRPSSPGTRRASSWLNEPLLPRCTTTAVPNRR